MEKSRTFWNFISLNSLMRLFKKKKRESKKGVLVCKVRKEYMKETLEYLKQVKEGLQEEKQIA